MASHAGTARPAAARYFKKKQQMSAVFAGSPS
ncbi:hypothetical protein EH244_02640 [Variovorax beijingensis]|uniref:Uncharacterized protein n=1 Tax=Variovorax beijingensis TaxID=2496117 RepID=A0A3P3F3L4_9BURK|nr:hypothetical protein EH244_02640 [Variovorax beijingensis]RSZ43234.1 hypothetical protein EJO66_05170 [Variovorax beijingensis]